VFYGQEDAGVKPRVWWRALRNRLRSLSMALRASGRFGRSIRLRKQGRVREALEVAREGLVLLRDPAVRRDGPEGSVIVSLTIQVEWLARQLGEPGAAERDLADSVRLMKGIAGTATGRAAETNASWLPRLEARLAESAGDAEGAESRRTTRWS
jgi:hypothetical protein